MLYKIFRLSLLFILIDIQNHNYFSISVKRIINQSKNNFQFAKKLLLWQNYKETLLPDHLKISEIKKLLHIWNNFFHNTFPTYCLSQALSSLSSILSNLNAKYFFSVYAPSWQPFKMKFPKKFVSHNVWNLHQVQGQQILKSIIRPNKSLCERQTSLVKNHILYYAWQKWSCGDTRFDICG